MLQLLDELLRKLLIRDVTGLQPPVGMGQPPIPVTSDQVRFDPPEDGWRTAALGNQNRNALNVYLVDLRENRKLRTNERIQEPTNGIFVEEQAPARMDCHYLVTAWSPTSPAPQAEPALDEHVLLYEVMAVLIREGSLNPSRLYPQGANPWPARFQDVELPMVVAPPEGFLKLAEFWGTMGTKHPWRPALYLIITIPVTLAKQQAGYMATSMITSYQQVS
jgi:hypothetical protein